MSRSATIRARAAHVVAQVANAGRSLDAVLAEERTDTAQERGLLRTLCFESVRWYVRLDALLARLLTRPGQKLEPEVHALAIVGLAQLLYTDIPPHAAVDETVNATRALRQPRAAGLINALLRRCQREAATLGEAIDRDPAIRTAHPRWLYDRIVTDWGERAGSILAANNERPAFWLRVNTRRIAADAYKAQLETAGHEVAASLFDGTALRLAQPVDVHELPGFDEGLVSVQDAAAQVAAQLLAPPPDARVLDACAAPGGKTCHLLELQPALSELIAMDVSGERLARVRENLQRLNLRATVLIGDAAAPQSWWDGKPFDSILLDVPCSATGVIRRHVDIKLLRRAQDIPALAHKQREILRHSWPMLRPGGRLVYASCSILRAETVDVVGDFLKATADARDITAQRWAQLPGKNLQEPDASPPGQAIATGTAGVDGFYHACLEKREG